jgi:hypothetical protein
MMDFAKKIQELESERQELKAQLNAKGIGGQERLVIRQQIIAIDRQITALYTLQSHQQPKACWRFSATFERLRAASNCRRTCSYKHSRSLRASIRPLSFSLCTALKRHTRDIP